MQCKNLLSSSCGFKIQKCIYILTLNVIKSGEFFTKQFKLNLYLKTRTKLLYILLSFLEIMKSKNSKKEPSSFVFDDDTSDSDDEDLDAFKSKIKEIAPGSKVEGVTENDDDNDDVSDEDSDADGAEGSNSEEEDDTEDEEKEPKHEDSLRGKQK